MHLPLRTRLALWYAALSMLSVLAVGAISTVVALQGLDHQFQARLDDQADVVSSNFNNPSGALGKANVHSEAGIQVLDSAGKVLYATGALATLQKPVQSDHIELQGKRFRLTQRSWKRSGIQVGTIWVALPEASLLEERVTLYQTIVLGALLSGILTFTVGILLGRRSLLPLSNAAEHADQIGPEHPALIPYQGHQDEVYRLVQAINRLLQRIWSQQAFEKQFVGQVAHELGAPLTSLRGYAERLNHEHPHADLDRIIGVARDLQFTAHDLIQYARGRSEIELVLHFVPATELQAKLERLSEGVVFKGAWSRTFLLADVDRLSQALRNLFANARRVVGPLGHVECELQVQGEKAIFCTRDNGPGIAAEHMPHLFEPFYSGSGSYGLGLSVARKIAEQHGGSLQVHNLPDAGAEFILEIPLPADDLESEEDPDGQDEFLQA